MDFSHGINSIDAELSGSRFKKVARKAKPQHFHLSSKYMVFKITDNKKPWHWLALRRLGFCPGCGESGAGLYCLLGFCGPSPPTGEIRGPRESRVGRHESGKTQRYFSISEGSESAFEELSLLAGGTRNSAALAEAQRLGHTFGSIKYFSCNYPPVKWSLRQIAW